MNTIDELLEEVEYAVEANSFESQCLWQRFSNQEGVVWESCSQGKMITLGITDDMPVCMSVFVNTINGVNVLFYEMTSQVVDYRLVDKFLEQKFGIFYNEVCVDSGNFFWIINIIKEKQHE